MGQTTKSKHSSYSGGLILSGGPDSAVAAWLSIEYEKDVSHWTAFHFRYGQLAIPEERCAQLQANSLGVPLIIVDLPKGLLTSTMTSFSNHRAAKDLEPTFVPGRNDIFISMTAAKLYDEGKPLVVVGGWNVVDAAGYPDCRSNFLALKERSLTAALDCKLKISAPVLSMSKKSIIQTAAALGIPLSLTWSCYTPTFIEPNQFHPCNTCISCKLRKKGFEEANLQDPLTFIAAEEGVEENDT